MLVPAQIGSDDSEVLLTKLGFLAFTSKLAKFSSEALLIVAAWLFASTWVAISLVTRFFPTDGLKGEAGMWLFTVIGTDSRDLAGVNLFLDFGGLGLGKADLLLAFFTVFFSSSSSVSKGFLPLDNFLELDFELRGWFPTLTTGKKNS